MGAFDPVLEELAGAGVTRSDRSPPSTFFCDLTPPEVAERLHGIGWVRERDSDADLAYRKDEFIVSIRSGGRGTFSVLYFEVDSAQRDLLGEIEEALPPLSEFQALPIPEQEERLSALFDYTRTTTGVYSLDDLDGYDKLQQILRYRNDHILHQVRRSQQLTEMAEQVRRSITNTETGEDVVVPKDVARDAILYVIKRYADTVEGPWSTVELDHKREVLGIRLVDTMDRDYLIEFLREAMPDSF